MAETDPVTSNKVMSLLLGGFGAGVGVPVGSGEGVSVKGKPIGWVSKMYLWRRAGAQIHPHCVP